MPKRPQSHKTADEATNDVAGVWIKCGCACDRVSSDYGEDLIVQPTFGTVVDPFRILIQVKGTASLPRFQRSNAEHRLSIPTQSVFRWARSSDLTVIVLWDVKQRKGLWSIPSEGFDDWRYHLDPTATTSIVFPSDQQFDEDRARQICWRARVRYFDKLIAEAHITDADIAGMNSHAARHGLASFSEHKSSVPLLAVELLSMLGILSPDLLLDPQFSRSYQNATLALRKKGERSGRTLRMMAMTLAVLGRVDSLSGHGMSIALLRTCTELAMRILELSNTDK